MGTRTNNVRGNIDLTNDRVRARGYHEARYDAASRRCYVEIYEHYTRAAGQTDVERRRLYDAFSDELLAITDVRSGKMSGHGLRPTSPNDLGLKPRVGRRERLHGPAHGRPDQGRREADGLKLGHNQMKA